MTGNLISNIDFFSLEENVKNNFKLAHQENVLAHTLQVRYNALNLAKRFSINEEQAATAALLHDISATIPVEDYIDFAKNYDLDIYDAEYKYPNLLHQRISRIIAVDLFNISDKEVLNAINFHTTLRKNASDLDKLIFMADKTAWADSDLPDYMPQVLKKLETSLGDAVDCYINNMMHHKEQLKAIHPWLLEAWEEIKTH